MNEIWVWTIWAGESSPHRTIFNDEVIADYYDRANQYFEKYLYWFADAEGNPIDLPAESIQDWDDHIITRVHLGWHGAPSSEQIEAARLMNWLYGQHWGTVGGPLHIILDDGNIEDRHIDYCLPEVDRIDFPNSSPQNEEDKTKCRRLLELLKPMTREERAQAIVAGERMEGPY